MLILQFFLPLQVRDDSHCAAIHRKKSKDDDIRSSLSEASFVLGSIVMILSSLSMFCFSDPAYFLSHLFPSLFAENGSNSNLDLFNPILNIPVNVYYVILPAIGDIDPLPFLYALEGHDSTSDKDWILASLCIGRVHIFLLEFLLRPWPSHPLQLIRQVHCPLPDFVDSDRPPGP